VRGRVRVRGEGVIAAALSVFTRDNRRYGGYVVHIGIALLTFGIISSSMFRTYEDLYLPLGESRQVGAYVITPLGTNRSFREFEAAFAALHSGSRSLAEIEPGAHYLLDELRVRVSRAAGGFLPKAHGEAEDAAGRAAAGSIVCELRPERRYYPKQEEWIPEVSIDRGILRDIYITYRHRDGDNVRIEVFLNPMMLLIWLGWFTMLGGGLYALLPLGRGRVGLSE
jgi:cytochrome c-type biogenesis protein CcmF